MTVLSIIGGILLIILIYEIIVEIDKLSYLHHRYKFFSFTNYLLVSGGYFIIYFGYNLYQEALKHNTDILDGKILIFIGACMLIYVILENFSNIPLKYAIPATIFQFGVFLVGAFVGLAVLVLALLFLAQTKPVYTINDCKD